MTAADELLLDTPAAQPCTHPRARHQHGTRAAYVCDRCRCHPCTRANSDAENARNRQQAYGRWQPYVDAEPARRHARQLMAGGMGWKRIAKTAGLAPSTVCKLLYGDPKRNIAPSKRLRPATEKAILGIGAPNLAPGTPIDPTGTTRRVQALVAVGWSLTRIGERIGISSTNMPALIDARQVQVRTAAKVRGAYEQLAYSSPPAASSQQRAAITRARRMGAQRGWAPPAAWFLVDIDDPDAAPDVEGVRATKPRRAPEELVEDVEWFVRTGIGREEAGRRLDIADHTLDKALHRAGRGDLWAALRTGPRPARTETTDQFPKEALNGP